MIIHVCYLAYHWQDVIKKGNYGKDGDYMEVGALWPCDRRIKNKSHNVRVPGKQEKTF